MKANDTAMVFIDFDFHWFQKGFVLNFALQTKQN